MFFNISKIWSTIITHNQMDRPQRLQVNETIHRHRLRDQSQRNEQDELYGLTSGKFAGIKKVRIFAA